MTASNANMISIYYSQRLSKVPILRSRKVAAPLAQIFFTFFIVLTMSAHCEAIVSVIQLSFTLTPSRSERATTVQLHQRKKPASKAKGFGKLEELQPSTSRPLTRDETKPKLTNFQSATTTTKFVQNTEVSSDSISVSSANAEERAKNLLREKYGMKTLADQQLGARQLANMKEEKRKWVELKKKAKAGDDFDLFSVLPGPVLIGIDRFLKAGTAFCSILFLASGVLIAVEAWSKASGESLPTHIDDFIVNTIEPNFTPGLLVLLSFSISLGIFASLQLGSQGASYKED